MAFQSLPGAAATALQVSGWFLTGVAIASGLATSLSSETKAETVLSGFVTTGADLQGAQVTAGFLNGGSETLTWQARGEAGGGVFGNGWSLGQRLDSFNYPWVFEVDADTVVSYLSINLLEGNALFDVEASVAPTVNTTGSKLGAAFSVQPGSLFGDALEPSLVSYGSPIDISQGDLFAELLLEWENGLGNGGLAFIADTDSGTAANPVRLVDAPVEPPQAIAIPLAPADRVTVVSQPQSVPEASSLLALCGLVGLVGVRSANTMCRKA